MSEIVKPSYGDAAVHCCMGAFVDMQWQMRMTQLWLITIRNMSFTICPVVLLNTSTGEHSHL